MADTERKRALEVRCFALDPSGTMQRVPEEDAIAAWREGEGTYWIDVAGGTPGEVREWLVGHGMDAAKLAPLRFDEDEAHVLPLDDAVYAVFPFLVGDDAGAPGHLHAIAVDRLVVTMHEAPAVIFELVDTQLARIKLPEGTTAGLVCALVLFYATRIRRHVVQLRKEGDRLARRMAADPLGVGPDELLALKERALDFGGLIDDELSVLEVFKVVDKPSLRLTRVAARFQGAIDILRATERDIERLDRRAGDLQHRYEWAQQDRTNQHLGRLTMISAIFMPLTLIAGIYGMNFDVMPELHWPWAYPIALSAMVLIAVGLYASWRRAGWMK